MPKKQTDLYLVVRGDSNDADFVTQITPITEEELKKFQPLIAAIKKFKKYKGMTDPTKHSGAPHEYSHDSNCPVANTVAVKTSARKLSPNFMVNLRKSSTRTTCRTAGRTLGTACMTLWRL